jgi:hypothetical protein
MTQKNPGFFIDKLIKLIYDIPENNYTPQIQ